MREVIQLIQQMQTISVSEALVRTMPLPLKLIGTCFQIFLMIADM